MSLSELNIHLINQKVPKVKVVEYSNFSVVEIDTSPTIKLFLYSQQELVNFKNNFLWAFERPEVIG